MPRSLRIEYPGAFYHVMARGNRREAIYLDDDRRLFLSTLGEACAMTGWRVHAWVLMSNHYHVVIETPEANLVAGMQWLASSSDNAIHLRVFSFGAFLPNSSIWGTRKDVGKAWRIDSILPQPDAS